MRAKIALIRTESKEISIYLENLQNIECQSKLTILPPNLAHLNIRIFNGLEKKH